MLRKQPLSLTSLSALPSHVTLQTLRKFETVHLFFFHVTYVARVIIFIRAAFAEMNLFVKR